MQTWKNCHEHLNRIYNDTIEEYWKVSIEEYWKVSIEVNNSIHKLLHQLEKERRSIPIDIYPCPGNEICIEWQKEGIIDRILINETNKGNRMITFPDDRPAQHYELNW